MFTNQLLRLYLLLLPLARDIVSIIKLLDDMRKVHRPCLLTGKLRMHVSSAADHVKLEKAYTTGRMLVCNNFWFFRFVCYTCEEFLAQLK